tara:strand:- start:206 stop:439 length:234 start_codon:yes stop_codon:yes gene_type:complete
LASIKNSFTDGLAVLKLSRRGDHVTEFLRLDFSKILLAFNDSKIKESVGIARALFGKAEAEKNGKIKMQNITDLEIK